MTRIFQVMVLTLAVGGASCADQAAKDVQATSSPLGAATLHYGCCDASAGVAVSSNLFIVANATDAGRAASRHQSTLETCPGARSFLLA